MRKPDVNGNPYPTREECYIIVSKTANSNEHLTNLILKKVILPGMGMEKDGTSEQQIGLLWDEFRGHSSKVVKEFCTSLPCFTPNIIHGGLTPVAQPLDKVINKVFKAYFRDLYKQYILTAPIGKSGNPTPPSRQLLSTWVVEAWEKIPEELVNKSWTACGYPQEKDVTTNNANAMVVWSEKDIGAMVEALCGTEIRTNFDDVECGPDEHFPSDDECSSDNECSDDNESEDDNVEEVYVEPAPMRKSKARDDCNMCAAGDRCGMKTTKLDGLHKCLICGKRMHGFLCGALWDERGDECMMTVKDLSELGQKRESSIGALIGYTCMKV